MKQPGVRLIDPERFGRRPLDAPVFDADCAARADQTLKEMSGSFRRWLESDVAALQQARLSAEQAQWSAEALDAVLNVAHDIKGLGTTYEYPLVSQLAASLCRLIESEPGRAAASKSPQLMVAHVDAIRAAARERIKSSEHPLGRALLSVLQAQVDALVPR